MTTSKKATAVTKTARATKAAVKPAVKTTTKKDVAMTAKKPAAKKATLSKTVRVPRNAAKPAPRKTAMAKLIQRDIRIKEEMANLVVAQVVANAEMVVTHKDQPEVKALINKDLWLPMGDNGKLVKYGSMKLVSIGIGMQDNVRVNFFKVWCEDAYLPVHQIRKIGSKFVFDAELDMPSKRDTVMVASDTLIDLGRGKAKKARATKTEKVTVKVPTAPKTAKIPKVTTDATAQVSAKIKAVQAKIKTAHPDSVTHTKLKKTLAELRAALREQNAKPAKVVSAKDAKPSFSTVLAQKGASVVKIGALRNDVRAAGVKVSADNGVFTLTRDRQVIGVVTLEVTATGRKLTAHKANAKGRLVNYRHAYGTTKTFKSMVTGIDATTANSIKHIADVINDDVAELAVDLCA